MPDMIIDAWIQHPTPAFIDNPMFASLRRWRGGMQMPEHILHGNAERVFRLGDLG